MIRWCAKSKENCRRFLDDYHLHVARAFDSLPDDKKAEVRPDRLQEIKEREARVLETYGGGPGKRSVMLPLEEICRQLSAGQGQPDTLWEYENYYRDVSRFAHPTAWQLFYYRGKGTPITEITPLPDTAFRALLVSAGSFLRILQRWNDAFNRLPQRTPNQWLTEWMAEISPGGRMNAEGQ